jgi:CubicO group peptidase (beta-lactamase class C family)
VLCKGMKCIVKVVCIPLFLAHPLVFAEPPKFEAQDIDLVVQKAMDTFKVPGIAVGITSGGKVIHAKGYGVRQFDKKGAVSSETLFGIGSVSKAFTTAALALLVDEGKIRWDDKVINHIPEFQLYDPWVTREFTIRDLLVHNSGLGLGAGDLLFVPSPAANRKEIIHSLRYLKPVTSFRSEYAYDNLLYVVAGEIIPAVTGQSFEDYVDARLLKPLKMDHCAANRKSLKRHRNVAQAHLYFEGRYVNVERLELVHQASITAAAGGIQCSVDSLLKWLNMHLDKGGLPNGDVLLSEAQQAQLHTPRTIMNVKAHDRQWLGSHYKSYGLGWWLQDVKGYEFVAHTGGLPGMVSYVAMLPELDLGIAILINQHSGAALRSIMTHILSVFTPVESADWVARFKELDDKRVADAQAEIDISTQHAFSFSGDLKRYTGTYNDPWFGNVEISKQNGKLHFKSYNSKLLRGMMEANKNDIFIVRWDDRTLKADAYVKFTTGYDGKPHGITMRAISPLTDFSFDFHDLNFERVKN